MVPILKPGHLVALRLCTMLRLIDEQKLPKFLFETALTSMCETHSVGRRPTRRISNMERPEIVPAKRALVFRVRWLALNLCKLHRTPDMLCDRNLMRRAGIVKLLIEGGADIHARNSEGRTPIQQAHQHVGKAACYDFRERHSSSEPISLMQGHIDRGPPYFQTLLKRSRSAP